MISGVHRCPSGQERGTGMRDGQEQRGKYIYQGRRGGASVFMVEGATVGHQYLWSRALWWGISIYGRGRHGEASVSMVEGAANLKI